MTDRDTVQLGTGWVLVLAELGIKPTDVLRRARLPEDLATRPDARLPSRDYFRLWEAGEAEYGGPALALRIGERLSAEAFHPAMFASLCSPNLMIAAQRNAVYKRLIGPMVLDVEQSSRGLYLGIRWTDPSVVVPPGLAALELIIFVKLARIATRQRICPVHAESTVELPEREQYEEWFGVPIEQGERHGVTFSPEDAERPFLTASDSMWSTFEPELKRRLSHLDENASLQEKVRAVLLESLPAGEASVEAVSKRLGMASRSLQRHLKTEGTNFKAVVNQTRERLARHYLQKTNLPYNEISFLVGFDEPSSFFRAFREWTGSTPDRVRTELAN